MRDLIEALLALVIVVSMTVLPWALGCAYMLGWLR
jgi:hypothetical protein